jgi:hypothetical protein
MPQGFIESTNIGISSINSLKDIHTSTAWNKPDSSINGLRNWFRDNIGNQGAFYNNNGSGEYVAFSNFSNTTIYGLYAGGWSETTSTYANANNGGVTFTAYAGDGNKWSFRFYLETKGWVYPSTNDSNTGTAFHGLNSGTYDAQITHRSLPGTSFKIHIGYGNGGTSLVVNYWSSNLGRTVSESHDIRTTQQFVIDPPRLKKLS